MHYVCIMAMLIAGAAGTVATLTLTTAMPDRREPATPRVRQFFLQGAVQFAWPLPYTSIETADPVERRFGVATSRYGK